jgi:hypothetical protein
MRKNEQDVPGSSKRGKIDTRSTDAHGQQADEVKSHAERAKEKGPEKSSRTGEVAGAMKDETAR